MKNSKFKDAIDWIQNYYETVIDSAKSDNISLIYSAIIIAVLATPIFNSISTATFSTSTLISAGLMGLEAVDVAVNYKLQNRSTFLFRAIDYTVKTLLLPIVGIGYYLAETVGYKIDNYLFEKTHNYDKQKHINQNEELVESFKESNNICPQIADSTESNEKLSCRNAFETQEITSINIQQIVTETSEYDVADM